MIFPWWLASLIANAAIITTEYINRTAGQSGILAAWSKSWWLILLAQACLTYCYAGAPSLMMAWIVFTVGNSMLRLTMAGTMLDETLNWPWAAAGVLAMMGASYCIKMATTPGA